MNVLISPLHIVRIVAGMLFVTLAGVLTLVATGVGRLGWMLAGDRPSEPFRADADVLVGTPAHAM